MSTLRILLVSLSLAGGMPAAFADDAGSQKALQKAQFMLRQVTSEKADLQTQIDEQKKQVDSLTKELATAKSKSSDLQQQHQEKLSNTVAQWKQHDEKQSEQLSTLRDQLKSESRARLKLEDGLKAQTNNFSTCYTNNQKLYAVNRELLDLYRRKGIVDTLKQKEPFTGLKEVEVENLIQDYQYQLDDLKIKTTETDISLKPGGEVAAP